MTMIRACEVTMHLKSIWIDGKLVFPTNCSIQSFIDEMCVDSFFFHLNNLSFTWIDSALVVAKNELILSYLLKDLPPFFLIGMASSLKSSVKYHSMSVTALSSIRCS